MKIKTSTLRSAFQDQRLKVKRVSFVSVELTFQGPNQGFTTPPRQSRYKILRCKCLAIEFRSTVEDSVKYAVYMIAPISQYRCASPHYTAAEQLVPFMEFSFPHRRHTLFTPGLGLHTLSRIVHCVLCCPAC